MTMQGEFFFDDALSAQDYAKQHPGSVLTRVHGADGYVVYQNEKNLKKRTKSISPQFILDYLNLHVISQNEAKEEIALSLYYHHVKYEKRNHQNFHNNGPVMLIGPTGTGKTFLVQKGCECVGIPYVHVDTASMVPEGIVGYCVSDLMADILLKAGFDKSKAEHAVVFFDEVDKLFNGSTDSEYGKKIAQQMLRMIEGDTVKLSKPIVLKNDEVFRDLDTRNMQFIFGGAFQWLLDANDHSAPVIGFASRKQESARAHLSVEDLYASGVAKEFLGRVSTVVSLHPLNRDNIHAVLTKSQSSPLHKYMEKIVENGCQAAIPFHTIQNIAEEAANHPLGVRSLDFILKRLFKKALFESPLYSGKTYVIDYI